MELRREGHACHSTPHFPQSVASFAAPPTPPPWPAVESGPLSNDFHSSAVKIIKYTPGWVHSFFIMLNGEGHQGEI